MRLTPEQLAQFDRDGYLFFPGLFKPEEARMLTEAVPELYARREAYNVREKDSDAVRTNFAAHMYSAPFARLARHPRVDRPDRLQHVVDSLDQRRAFADQQIAALRARVERRARHRHHLAPIIARAPRGDQRS